MMFSSPKFSWLDMSVHCSKGICIFQKEIETVDEPITRFSLDVSHSLLILRVYHHTTLFLFGSFYFIHFPFSIIRFLFSFPLLFPKSFFLFYSFLWLSLSFFFALFFYLEQVLWSLHCLWFAGKWLWLLESLIDEELPFWYLTSWCARDTHWNIVLFWCTLLIDEG